MLVFPDAHPNTESGDQKGGSRGPGANGDRGPGKELDSWKWERKLIWRLSSARDSLGNMYLC